MSSSISNSDYKKPCISAVTALIMLAAMFALRPHLDYRYRDTGLQESHFWQQKYEAKGDYDYVIAGDSRVYHGVVPEEIESILGGARVLNFGFSATGFGKDYLERLPQLLNPEGEQRIVFSMTPWSLTQEAMKDNGYLHNGRKRNIVERLEDAWGAHFPPIQFPDLFAILGPESVGRRLNRVHSHYHTTGWVEIRVSRMESWGSTAGYTAIFKNNQVEEATVAIFLDYIAQFSARGIQVFGMRMPIDRQLREVEGRASGLDWVHFLKRFNDSGGIWLGQFDDEEYQTYDGSHLTGDEARRFSRTLAQELRRARKVDVAIDSSPDGKPGKRPGEGFL